MSSIALLNNKKYKINSILTSVFGDLVTNEVEIIDENRLESTMRFQLKDFSEFKHMLNASRSNDQWFVVRIRDGRNR